MFRVGLLLSLCLTFVVLDTTQPSMHRTIMAQDADPVFREFQKLFNEGRYDEAILMGERVVEVTTQTKTANEFKLLVQLAALYRATGEFGKAANTFRRAIALGDQILAPTDPALGSAFERFACFEQRMGHLDEAKKLQARAVHLIAPLPPGFRPGPVTGTVVNGKPLAMPQPAYPKLASRLKVEGTVSVDVIIDETGRPIVACTKEGPELLALNAEAAAFRARFTPTTLDKVPVRVSGRLIYNFRR